MLTLNYPCPSVQVTNLSAARVGVKMYVSGVSVSHLVISKVIDYKRGKYIEAEDREYSGTRFHAFFRNSGELIKGVWSAID